VKPAPAPASASAKLDPAGALLELLRPHDPLFLEPGPAGELLLARLRVGLAWLLLALANFAPLAEGRRSAALGAAVAVLAVALVALALVGRWFRPAWPWVLTVLDVLLAAALVRADQLLAEVPAGASSTGVELLLLAVLASALRDDPRCVLLAGVLSALLLRGHAAEPLLALAAGTVLCALLVARARRLYPLAEHEALTGLPRRTAFEQRLALETARSQRHERPFALALVGIADLPRLIEQQGHARGNAVLRAAASLLRRTLRQTDTVASLEPGLFALLLPETRVASAEPRLERLCQELRAAAQGGVGPAAGVDVRLGVVGCPEEGREPASLLELAERRLERSREPRSTAAAS
jgi:diguanylate cyclase (GGDEF)-like protein